MKQFPMISRLIGDKVREYVEAGKILNKDNYVASSLVGAFDSNPDSMSRDEIKF